MKLSKADSEQFHRLYSSLLRYINDAFNVIGRVVNSPDEMRQLPADELLRIREILYNQLDLIERFVDENPDDLSEGQLNQIRRWKHAVRGAFYILRISRLAQPMNRMANWPPRQ